MQVLRIWGIIQNSSYYLNVEQLHIATLYPWNILNGYRRANFQTETRKQATTTKKRRNMFCNIFIIEMALLQLLFHVLNCK